ncbi:MAG TPA: hypothetical protein VHE83_14030 [Mycobacteriales bacterium]|nr:hypothetical protein [Mycobacteriales bacterium]
MGVAVRVPYMGTLKVLAVLGIVGVLGFDGVSIGLCHVSTQDDANSAALAAMEEWGTHHNVNDAYAAAQQSASGHGETVLQEGFTIDPKTSEVTLRMTRKATTVVLGSVHESWVEIAETGTAKPSE